jgi:NADPH2:quinone reductase
MKAIQIENTGDPDVMQYADVPTPEPGDGMARVRVEAIGVNFIDIYKRKGQYKMPLPFTPGEECAGVVDAIGPGVTEVRVGDRVGSAFAPGAYAEFAIVPANKLVPLPPIVSAKDAAAILLQGMTAHYLTHDTYPINPGDTVLIHAAAGGTGALAVQMAKLRGARVFGTTSTPDKAAIAKQAGADEVFLYDTFEAEVKQATGGNGVHAVYDSVGKDTFDRSLNCLRPRGMMVLFGQASGPVPPFELQTLNAKGSLYVTRPSLGAYILTREALLARAGAVLDMVAKHQINVRVDSEYALNDAPAAHVALASRGTTGKILLIP